MNKLRAAYLATGAILTVLCMFHFSRNTMIQEVVRASGGPPDGAQGEAAPQAYEGRVTVENLGSGITHTVVVTLQLTKGGAPAQGIPVFFGVRSGPHFGMGGDVKTDSRGFATYSFKNDGKLGQDLIYVSTDVGFHEERNIDWVQTPGKEHEALFDCPGKYS